MKILLFANTDWYLFNFRLSLATRLRAAGHEVLLVSPSGRYGTKLQELGFRWNAAPMDRRSLNPVRELALLSWLWQLMKVEQPDVVHGFTIKCAIYGSLAAKLAKVPAHVSAVAGMGYVFTSDHLRARILRPVVRALLRVALDGKRSRLILQNPDDVVLFSNARLVHPERVRLIPGSGVDCTRFAPDGLLDKRSDKPFRVVLPARLLWDKGLGEYVEAAKLLLREGRKIEFLIAGEPDPGNPAAASPNAVKEWETAGLVRWLGHVDDMPALYRSVDAVVLPSYREGLPKGLIEGAACGLPLVATDVPGCRSVVSDGVTGLLVPARNGQSLARAIARLQDEPELRIRLGHAARRRALSEFDERVVNAQTLHVYEELLAAQ